MCARRQELIQLTLPYPPSVNRAYRTVSGRVILSKAGREYRDDVAAAVYLDASRLTELLKGRLSVSIKMHAPDNRKRDVDNVLKCALDALTHAGIWDDDSQIDRLLVERAEPAPKYGFVVVSIEQI